MGAKRYMWLAMLASISCIGARLDEETCSKTPPASHLAFVVNYQMGGYMNNIQIGHTALLVCNVVPQLYSFYQGFKEWCAGGGSLVYGCWAPEQSWTIKTLNLFTNCEEYEFGDGAPSSKTMFGRTIYYRRFTVPDASSTTIYPIGETSYGEVEAAFRLSHECTFRNSIERDFNENTYHFFLHNCHSFVNFMINELKLPYFSNTKELPKFLRPERLIRAAFFTSGAITTVASAVGSAASTATTGLMSAINSLRKYEDPGEKEWTFEDLQREEVNQTVPKSRKCIAQEEEFFRKEHEEQVRLAREEKQREKEEQDRLAQREKEEQDRLRREENARLAREKEEKAVKEWTTGAAAPDKRPRTSERGKRKGKPSDAEADPAAGPPRKRRRPSEEATDRKTVWQVRLGRNWVQIGTDEDQMKLAEAQREEQESVILDVGGRKFEYDFVEKKQINPQTGAERDIREVELRSEMAKKPQADAAKRHKGRKDGPRAEAAADACDDRDIGGNKVWQVKLGRAWKNLDKECQAKIQAVGHRGTAICIVRDQEYEMNLDTKKQIATRQRTNTRNIRGCNI
eukprot:TRINITY_DN3203_c0_g1_i1.p1 TRINITY_DN3203_c0_g1~~TRINITY_DN3203_c0_g1_i1.p1  ORF type:complete len:596 (+),score=73.60 TRINITY_DN3203_c0_g1_i1:81-1790(+)